MNKIDLNSNWGLRFEDLNAGPGEMPEIAREKDGWIDATVPCDIHTPLIENGIINDPVDAKECFNSEWIEEKSWWFKKIFDVDQRILDEDAIELTLESLDAEADIFLNGFYLGHHKSSHYPFIQEVKEKLFKEKNTLIIFLVR